MGYSHGFMQFFLEVTKEDLPIVRELAQRIWNDHYPDIIGQEQVDYMLEKMYDLNSLELQLEKGDIFYLSAVGESEADLVYAGFASVKDFGDGRWFLNKLYVDTELQRSGLGKGLMDFLVEEHSMIELRLQVNRQNYKAINFYFRNGFVIESVADFDIGDGYFMNDFIMLKVCKP
jgi:ribosomal protein S18 acetylase RimI-like enzyme